MLRYTVFRLLIFFGCLLFFWLVGLRNDQILLLLVSAAASVLLSFFLLRSQRDRFSEQIADRMEKRQETASPLRASPTGLRCLSVSRSRSAQTDKHLSPEASVRRNVPANRLGDPAARRSWMTRRLCVG